MYICMSIIYNIHIQYMQYIGFKNSWFNTTARGSMYLYQYYRTELFE